MWASVWLLENSIRGFVVLWSFTPGSKLRFLRFLKIGTLSNQEISIFNLLPKEETMRIKVDNFMSSA